MSMLLLILSMLLLMFLCYKGVPPFYSAFMAGLFLLITAGLPPVNSMITTYTQGLSGNFGNFFFVFAFGAIFGKLSEVSGAAESIAQVIGEKLGEKHVVLAILIALAIMSYGGISFFVAFFAVYPMMVSLFRKINLSRSLMPGIYFAGTGSFTIVLPGSPQLHNLIPIPFLGTNPMSGAIPGFIAGFVYMALVLIYVFWAVRNSRKKGQTFEMTKADEELLAKQEGKKRPNALLAIMPMAVLLILLNGLKLRPEVALLGGVLAGLIFYFKFIDWKNVWKTLEAGLLDGVKALFVVSSMVGFGALAQLTPAFQTILDKLTHIGGNPLIASAMTVALICGIIGGGTGGLGVAMPIITKYFVPMGVNLSALHRVCVFAGVSLGQLPHNAIVNMVIGLCGSTPKKAYIHQFVIAVLLPSICAALVTAICILFPGWV